MCTSQLNPSKMKTLLACLLLLSSASCFANMTQTGSNAIGWVQAKNPVQQWNVNLQFTQGTHSYNETCYGSITHDNLSAYASHNVVFSEDGSMNPGSWFTDVSDVSATQSLKIENVQMQGAVETNHIGYMVINLPFMSFEKTPSIMLSVTNFKDAGADLSNRYLFEGKGTCVVKQY